jgi:hypothetical protein
VLLGASNSYLSVAEPHLESTRCVSTSICLRRFNSDTASGAPVAPVTATTILLRVLRPEVCENRFFWVDENMGGNDLKYRVAERLAPALNQFSWARDAVKEDIVNR